MASSFRLNNGEPLYAEKKRPPQRARLSSRPATSYESASRMKSWRTRVGEGAGCPAADALAASPLCPTLAGEDMVVPPKNDDAGADEESESAPAAAAAATCAAAVAVPTQPRGLGTGVPLVPSSVQNCSTPPPRESCDGSLLRLRVRLGEKGARTSSAWMA